jgi:hypothetical protein
MIKNGGSRVHWPGDNMDNGAPLQVIAIRSERILPRNGTSVVHPSVFQKEKSRPLAH